MRKSQETRNRIPELSGLVMLLIFVRPHLCLAQPRQTVEVRLETEWHVGPPHTVEEKKMNLIFRPLKLTYHIPPTPEGQPVTVRIAPGPVKAGAGLVVEHIAPARTRTTQSLAPEPWWFSKAQTLEIESSTFETYFNVWVLPGMYFDFSELGIYRISYAHPWAEPQEDPNSLLYRSNTLTIACVTQERYNQLHATLRQNADLAFASYRFKNPPSAKEIPKYQRSVAKIIDEAIKKGTKQDEVLLLLGSPDVVSCLSAGQQETYDCDETWLFETSPVGGYSVSFKDGGAVGKTFYAQCGDSPGRRNAMRSDSDCVNE